MKNFLLNKSVIASLAFITGGLSVWGVTRTTTNAHLPEKKPNLITSYDPFEDMRRMQREAMQSFNESPTERIFDDWKKFLSASPSQDMNQREDTQFLYYEFDLKGQSPKEIKVEVKNGQVIVSGKVETQEQKENSSHYYSSSFHRSFPVPAGVDGNRFQTEQEGGKIVIKFPKMNS